MSLDLFIVDAFASEPLAGNPAAVCPLSAWLPDATMQAVAAELNQSETVFFAPKGDDFEIRWFTPTREVDHIGHATLAAGHIVMERMQPGRTEVRFLTKHGFMAVRRGTTGFVLDMASLVPSRETVTEAAAKALGATPIEAWHAKHHLFVFETVEQVAALTPDMRAVSELELPAVIATASAKNGIDFVSRFFAPANGVPEDAVSGVSHCCLAPYWARRLGKNRLIGKQLSKRGGTIVCELRGERVFLEGQSAVFLEGKIRLPINEPGLSAPV